MSLPVLTEYLVLDSMSVYSCFTIIPVFLYLPLKRITSILQDQYHVGPVLLVKKNCHGFSYLQGCGKIGMEADVKKNMSFAID